MSENGERIVKKLALFGFILIIPFAVLGCASPQVEHDDGLIIMTPMINREQGIRGVVPDGIENLLVFTQESVPATMDELYPMFLEQTGLDELPQPYDRLSGTAFNWDLYTVETIMPGSGLETVRIDIALTEQDMTTYFVAMISFPDDYNEHARMYETIFTHAVYALAPLQ